MIGLDELVAVHQDDQPGKRLFTAYAAAVPLHRVRVGVLVAEAVELDPIDLFLLEGIQAGLQSPRDLTLFFGLEQEVVDYSIGDMLHNGWVQSVAPVPGQLLLALLPGGQEVLADKRARVETEHEAEIWVDGLLRTCEVRPPRQRLLRPVDAKRQRLHRLPAIVQAPRQSADLDFGQLERSIAEYGPQLWPGTQLALLLDVLNVTGRGTGYRPVNVLVFQSELATEVDFHVYEGGARHEGYERALRRLEFQESRTVVPTEAPPAADELAEFQRERAFVLSLAASSEARSQQGFNSTEEWDAAQQGLQEVAPGSSQAEPIAGLDTVERAADTRERLRGELSAMQAVLREKDEVIQEQVRIISQQKLLRNHENRVAWKRVLLNEARRYVVMEFPWISGDAIDDEMLQCFENAIRRGVRLWIAWGLDEHGPAGGRPADPKVLSAIKEFQRAHGTRSIQMEYRGNTHRKVLLWDRKAAIIASFNWGSFRGDPRRRVREEIGAQITTPREVSDLEDEYKSIFSVVDLAGR